MKQIITSILFLLLATSADAQSAFVRGADVSWCTEMEASGRKFYDANGQETELFALLKQIGMNAVRLRVWVNPTGYGYGAWCDKDDVLKKAERAHQQGLDVMIDFHYSDFFADPERQEKPKDWSGYTTAQLKTAIADHTKEILTALKEKGIEPKWVQVGNETNHGFLFEKGKIDWDKKGSERYTGYVAPSNAGYDAVKEVFPDAIVIVHLDRGHKHDLYDYNLGIVKQYGGKFDMIGMSLYPYWAMEGHPELNADQIITDCIANIRRVSEKFGCDVMIVETGYEVDEKRPEIMEEGKRQLTRVIKEARYETGGHCRGVFYWEPQCLPGGYKLGAFNSQAAPTAIMDGFIE